MSSTKSITSDNNNMKRKSNSDDVDNEPHRKRSKSGSSEGKMSPYNTYVSLREYIRPSTSKNGYFFCKDLNTVTECRIICDKAGIAIKNTVKLEDAYQLYYDASQQIMKYILSQWFACLGINGTWYKKDNQYEDCQVVSVCPHDPVNSKLRVVDSKGNTSYHSLIEFLDLFACDKSDAPAVPAMPIVNLPREALDTLYDWGGGRANNDEGPGFTGELYAIGSLGLEMEELERLCNTAGIVYHITNDDEPHVVYDKDQAVIQQFLNMKSTVPVVNHCDEASQYYDIEDAKPAAKPVTAWDTDGALSNPVPKAKPNKRWNLRVGAVVVERGDAYSDKPRFEFIQVHKKWPGGKAFEQPMVELAPLDARGNRTGEPIMVQQQEFCTNYEEWCTNSHTQAKSSAMAEVHRASDEQHKKMHQAMLEVNNALKPKLCNGECGIDKPQKIAKVFKPYTTVSGETYPAVHLCATCAASDMVIASSCNCLVRDVKSITSICDVIEGKEGLRCDKCVKAHVSQEHWGKKHSKPALKIKIPAQAAMAPALKIKIPQAAKPMYSAKFVLGGVYSNKPRNNTLVTVQVNQGMKDKDRVVVLDEQPAFVSFIHQLSGARATYTHEAFEERFAYTGFRNSKHLRVLENNNKKQ